MKLSVLSVGRLKETYWLAAVQEYGKRLSKFGKVQILEVPDEPAPERLSAAQAAQLLEKEGQRLLKQIPAEAYVIALAIQGTQLSSEGLADFLNRRMLEGNSHFVFVIGGSLGLSPAVLDRADFLLSFSPMTFPHQLMRVLVLEQVYRSFKILAGEPYHK